MKSYRPNKNFPHDQVPISLPVVADSSWFPLCLHSCQHNSTQDSEFRAHPSGLTGLSMGNNTHLISNNSTTDARRADERGNLFWRIADRCDAAGDRLGGLGESANTAHCMPPVSIAGLNILAVMACGVHNYTTWQAAIYLEEEESACCVIPIFHARGCVCIDHCPPFQSLLSLFADPVKMDLTASA